MIKKIFSIIIFLIPLNSTYCQSVFPGMFPDKFLVKNKADVKVKYFPLSDIRLLPSRFHDNMKRDSAWISSIPINSLLHSFRTNAGIYSGNEGGYFTTKKLGGWESLDCDLRGHITGHLLSAFALMYSQTGNKIFKIKSDSLIRGLAEVQQTLGTNGYLSAFPENIIDRTIRGESVWAPWYTLHKILSGLIDQYLYCDNDQALNIAIKMSSWAYNKVSSLDTISLHKMIKFEYGGINESFYNIYAITADKRYLELAQLFYKKDNIEPLKHRQNKLGTLHANTFIPKVLAEARRYELINDSASRICAEFFMQLIENKYSFVNGEIGDHEHFFAPEDMAKHLTGYDGEGCCTYNLLKLCRHLFCWNPDENTIEYYERALYNHILGQQDTISGMICYFTPMQSGAYKLYSTKNDSYWCCVGTGFESNAKLGESVYAHDNHGIYINLFIPSVMNWKEKGIVIRQQTRFPNDNNVIISIDSTSNTPFPIYLRYPQWSDKPTIKINGKSFRTKCKPGNYITIYRKWKSGDEIIINYPIKITTESLLYAPHKVAIKYGPIVLAGELEDSGIFKPAPFSDPQKYNDYYRYDFNIPSSINTSIKKNEVDHLLRSDGKLEFKNSRGITIKPLFDIHRQRYVVYWDLK